MMTNFIFVLFALLITINKIYCDDRNQYLLLNRLLNKNEMESTKAPVSKRKHLPMESRIVGGVDAEVGKYPFFVSWGECAASLIAADIILSAAHCQLTSETVVSIGQSRKDNSDVGQGMERTITEKIIHPNYNAWSIDYDFMVLKLDQPIEFSADENNTSTTFIGLNNDNNIPALDKDLTVIGFGALSQFDSVADYPSRLQEVTVKAIPTEDCNGYSAYDGEVNNITMFCAGTVQGGKDACQGDSGGPIFYEKYPNEFVQVGIVSWGLGCAQARYPGVYSRISGAIDWIRMEICNLSEFKPNYCNIASDNENAIGNVPSPISGDAIEDDHPLEDVPSPNDGDSENSENVIGNNNTSSLDDNDNDNYTNGDNEDASIDDDSNTTVQVRLDITYDYYPSETGWTLQQNGDILMSKEAGNSEDNGFSQYRINLSPGIAAKFNITDTLGDGICCGFGNGKYEIYAEISNGEILLAKSDGKFKYGEEKEFDIPSIVVDDNDNFYDDSEIASSAAPVTMQPINISPITIIPIAPNTYDDDDFLIISTAAPITIQPATTFPTNLSPDETPNAYDDDGFIECKDSPTAEFYVDSSLQNKDCTWLNSNMVRFAYLCQFLDVAHECPNLCDVCQFFSL